MYRIDPSYTQKDWGAGFYEMDWDCKYKYLEKALATQPFIVGVCRYDNQDMHTEDRALLTQDGVEIAVIKGGDWENFYSKLTEIKEEIDSVASAIRRPHEERDMMISELSRNYYNILFQPIVEAVAEEPELAQYLPDEMFTCDKNLEEKIIEARKKVLEQSKTQGEKLYSKLMKLEDQEKE